MLSNLYSVEVALFYLCGVCMQYLYFEANRILWPKILKNFSLFSTFIKLHINYENLCKLEFSNRITVKKLLVQECNVTASSVCHVTCSSDLRSYNTKTGSFVNLISSIHLYVGNFCVLCVNCVHNNLTILP